MEMEGESVEFEQIKVTQEESTSVSTFEYPEDRLSDSLKKTHIRKKTTKKISTDSKRTRIVVTGFGPLHPKYYRENISSTIMLEFYNKYKDDKDIDVVKYPQDHDLKYPGIDSSYQYINDKHFDNWLREQDARVFIHLGIKRNNDFSTNPLHLETYAYNKPVNPDTGKQEQWENDYHKQNNDGKPCVSEGPDRLETAFDIPLILSSVTVTEGVQISLIQSKNAGRSLCNFLYYRSLYYANKSQDKYVLFIHVPSTLRHVTISQVVTVLRQIVTVLLDMLPPSARAQRPENPEVIGPIDVEPGQGIIIKDPEEDEEGSIYVDPGGGVVIVRNDLPSNDLDPAVYVDPAPIIIEEEREELLYTEISGKTRKGSFDDRGASANEVQYANVKRQRETMVEREFGVIKDEYAVIREEAPGTVEGRGAEVRGRRKPVAAARAGQCAHSRKKQTTRESRKRRRQKRNARQRKHK